MAKIKFETGQVVNFEGTPTQADIEEVAKKLKLGKKTTTKKPKEKGRVLASPEDTKKGGGFLKSIFKPAVTLASRPVQLAKGLAGATREEQALDLPFFGKIEAPRGRKDVIRDIGRGAETVALGIGAGAGRQIIGQTLKQKGLQALIRGIKGGAKAGAVAGTGAELVKTGEIDPSKIATAGAVGGVVGGATGGVLGGGAALAGAGARRGVEAVTRRVGEKTTAKLPSFFQDIQKGTLLKDAVEITKPVLKKKERISTLKRGTKGGEEKGLPFLKRIETKPSARDTKVAESVADVVQKGKNELENIDLVSQKVSRTNNAIKEELKQNDSIFNVNQLKSRLSIAKEKNRVIFGKEKTLEDNYDAIIQEMVDTIDKKKISNLFDARQEFDRRIRGLFPRTFDGTPSDNVRKNAILDVRRGVNEFIAELLPEGNTFKNDLTSEHLMLEALENIAEQAELKTRDSKLLNKILSNIGFSLLGAGATAGVFSLFGGR